MKLPSTVASIDTIGDMGGDYIEIVFKNGSAVRVSAENDGVHFYSKKAFESYENCDGPTVSLLVDLGAGHTERPDNEVVVMRGKDCKRLDVDHF